jgi:putative DNA primase/helicase
MNLDYQVVASRLNNFGLLVEHIHMDGQLQRVPTKEKPKSKNGWYIAYDDLVIVGDWQTGATETFKANGQHQTFGDKQRIKQSMARHNREREALQRQAATYATTIYNNASQVAIHPYLTFKGLVNIQGVRLNKDQLLIPLYDLVSMKVESLQKIFPNGEKRFLKNGRIKGLCCPCGFPDNVNEWPEQIEQIFICEGYATASSICQVTHKPVLAVMNANNLLPIGRVVKTKWPDAEIIIAGDDDYLTEQKTGVNPGKFKALEAASKVAGKMSLPPFRLEQTKAGLTDWNDYYMTLNSEVTT